MKQLTALKWIYFISVVDRDHASTSQINKIFCQVTSAWLIFQCINQVAETNSIRIRLRLAMSKVVTIETDHTSKFSTALSSFEHNTIDSKSQPWIWQIGINHRPLKIAFDIDQAFPVIDLNWMRILEPHCMLEGRRSHKPACNFMWIKVANWETLLAKSTWKPSQVTSSMQVEVKYNPYGRQVKYKSTICVKQDSKF